MQVAGSLLTLYLIGQTDVMYTKSKSVFVISICGAEAIQTELRPALQLQHTQDIFSLSSRRTAIMLSGHTKVDINSVSQPKFSNLPMRMFT